jgi:hypothetical protein
MDKRYTYDAAFKRKVILCTEQIGNRAAGKQFSVNETNVRRWRTMKNDLFTCQRTRKSFSGPKKGMYPELDAAVLSFFKELRGKGLPVTRDVLMLKAKEIARNSNIQFKASRGWCDKFIRREGLSLRRRTTICQKLPKDYEEKLVQYQRHVINLRHQRQYCLSQMGNADEVAVFFDMPRNYTLSEKGQKQVTVKTTGYEKLRVTVMLSVTADGNKLPPYIILNRKTMPKETFCDGVIVRAHKNAWMTAELMQDWLGSVWERRPGGLLNRNSMLVMDAFRGHLTEEIKTRLKNKNCDLVVIPGGMTSQLQPLDVGVNKPFKDRIRTQYNQWLSENEHALTPTGKIKRASAATLVEWISNAWKELKTDSITKSFLKCCLSNAEDGSQDDILWNDRDTNEADTSDSDIESDESVSD